MILYCYIIVIFCCLIQSRRAIQTLVAAPYILPSDSQYYDYCVVRCHAIVSIRVACIYAVVVLGYCHAYCQQRLVLLSQHEAAMAISVPNLGRPVNDRHVPSWMQSLTTTQYPKQDETEYAEYLQRINASTWPDPLLVFADIVIIVPLRWVNSLSDAIGSSIHAFLGHFSWIMQVLLVLTAAGVVMISFVGILSTGRGITVASHGRKHKLRQPEYQTQTQKKISISETQNLLHES